MQCSRFRLIFFLSKMEDGRANVFSSILPDNLFLRHPNLFSPVPPALLFFRLASSFSLLLLQSPSFSLFRFSSSFFFFVSYFAFQFCFYVCFVPSLIFVISIIFSFLLYKFQVVHCVKERFHVS